MYIIMLMTPEKNSIFHYNFQSDFFIFYVAHIFDSASSIIFLSKAIYFFLV